jgi:hypothetical protein
VQVATLSKYLKSPITKLEILEFLEKMSKKFSKFPKINKIGADRFLPLLARTSSLTLYDIDYMI